MEKFLGELESCPLFAGIARRELGEILGCLGARPVSYLKGQSILSEGDRASHFGVVLCGAVQVIREDYYGNRSIMTKLMPGGIFAEAFACAGVEKMPVSVIAAQNTDVLLIDANRLMHPCENSCVFHDQLIYNLMRILARKNLLCNQKIEVTSKRTTREKLMAYLMLEAKEAGKSCFAIPYDRQELADYLEVDRSGLSAEIGRLRREGVIRCEKNRFELLMQEHD